MQSFMTRFLSLSAAATLLVGCANEVVSPEEQLELSPAKGDETKQPLPWDARNDNPSIFAGDLVYTVEDLPREGQTATPPWPASYWPTYEDAINFKWQGQGTLSPAGKYAEAFGIDGVEDAVSRYHGIDSQSHRTACSETSECDSALGEHCAIRDGKDKGYCIPTWFGLCHAWAPASLIVPEPQRPVTKNGVEFKINDLKALATLVHNRTSHRFASRRCEGDESSDENGIDYDEHGRPKDGACIDTNPGTFHLLVSNFLGLREQGFVYDRTYDYQVWNQPIAAYRVTQLDEIDATQANQLVGVTTAGGTTVTHGAEVGERAWHHFEPMAVEPGAPVNVRMSGSGDGDLYVRFGAEPTTSAYDCRPYENGSDESCELEAPAGASQVYVSVYGYTPAEVDVNVTAGGDVPRDYLFNDAAERFFEVRLEVDFIVESSSQTDGALAGDSRYTRTDRYHYILEVDGNDRVNGGEWLGSSKRTHPDFVFLPLGSAQASVAGGKVSYAEVMDLVNQSITDEEDGQGDEVEVRESGSVSRAQLVHFGPFSTAAATSLVADMSGTGDADLYVRRGAPPTLTSYDCRPYKSGSTETCTVAGPGPVYVAVNGYAAASTFELVIRYTEPGDGDSGDDGDDSDDGDEPSSEHLDEAGSVAQGEMDVYELQVQAGQEVVVRTQAPRDVDLYVQFGQAPTTSSYAGIGYTASGNETVVFKASSAGTLYVGVHGYQASEYTLTTAAE